MLKHPGRFTGPLKQKRVRVDGRSVRVRRRKERNAADAGSASRRGTVCICRSRVPDAELILRTFLVLRLLRCSSVTLKWFPPNHTRLRQRITWKDVGVFFLVLLHEIMLKFTWTEVVR